MDEDIVTEKLPDHCKCGGSEYRCADCGEERFPADFGSECDECGYRDVLCEQCGQVYSYCKGC